MFGVPATTTYISRGCANGQPPGKPRRVAFTQAFLAAFTNQGKVVHDKIKGFLPTQKKSIIFEVVSVISLIIRWKRIQKKLQVDLCY